MKLIKYVISILPFCICFLALLFHSEEMNLILYMLYMAVPLMTTAVISGRQNCEAKYHLDDVIHALIGTAMYLVYFYASVVYVEHNGIYQIIYENSRNLFQEGFSIGTDFGTVSIVDGLLPGCFSFLVYFFFAKIPKKKETA